MAKHVKGERGIAEKMKRVILNSRYWCGFSFGLSQTFRLMTSFVLFLFDLRFAVHKSSSDDGCGGERWICGLL